MSQRDGRDVRIRERKGNEPGKVEEESCGRKEQGKKGVNLTVGGGDASLSGGRRSARAGPPGPITDPTR